MTSWTVSMPSLSQPMPSFVSIELFAIVVGTACTVGALVPDMSAATATAVLRSLGETAQREPTRVRDRVWGALACIGASAAALATRGVSLPALATWLLCLSLLIAADIDRRHHLLPDAVTLPLLWLGLLVNLGNHVAPLPDAVIGAVGGYLGLRILSLVVVAITQSDGIGHGDFKLLAAIGAWLGWQALPPVAFIAAALVVLVGLVRNARSNAAAPSRVAFGPALAVAATVVLFVPSLCHA